MGRGGLAGRASSRCEPKSRVAVRQSRIKLVYRTSLTHHVVCFFLAWALGTCTASSIGKRRDRVHATAVGRSDVGISIEEGGGRPPRAYQGFLFVVRTPPPPPYHSLQSRHCLPLGSEKCDSPLDSPPPSLPTFRLQRSFVFVALIDCALAKLLAEGTIVLSEIYVFSRAIEDVVDLLLIRSRSESELATLMSEVERLKSLDAIWSTNREHRLLPCRIQGADETEDPDGSIVLKNLQYSRGTASVSVQHLVIRPGIYALTGGEET
jgi:hypothetical protein